MEIRTRVSRSRNFDKQLSKVPGFIQEKVMAWIFIVETEGIWRTMKSRGFHDEPLIGQRQGQRSVRMNRAYRLIYRVVSDRIHLELLEIHKHDY